MNIMAIAREHHFHGICIDREQVFHGICIDREQVFHGICIDREQHFHVMVVANRRDHFLSSLSPFRMLIKQLAQESSYPIFKL